MDFRGRDKEDQPDTFTSQRHKSIESKNHVVLDRSGARLPLVNMHTIVICENLQICPFDRTVDDVRGVQDGGSPRV